MKNVFAAVVAVLALSAVPASAQDSGTTAAGSNGQSKHDKSNGSAQAQVGERAPGDASSSSSAEGRPRAGIEVGTASATQGGRTDNGTPPGRTSPNDRSAPGANPDRIHGQDAQMMTKDQQKKEASAAKKRGAARKDRSIARSKGSDAPNPDAEKSTTGNRKQ